MLGDFPKITQPLRVRTRLKPRTVPLQGACSSLSMNEWMKGVGDIYVVTHPSAPCAINTASHQPSPEVHGAF